ncbi:MAG: CBS domain-containing protein [Candidatus Methylomirabilis sp.]
MKQVRDFLQGEEVFYVSPALTVRQAAQYMSTKGIGAVPVLEKGRLVGIFTERDLLTRVVAYGLDPATTLVEEVMTKELVVADADDHYEAALEKMKDCNCRHLPVVEKDRLVGVVSMRDLLLAEITVKSSAIRMLDSVIQYKSPVSSGMAIVWKCLSCGHHVQGDQPPAHCPACRASREQFVLIEED